MGGKNAVIIDTSADLDEAVLGVRQSAFGFQGQKCSACSRIIVVDPAGPDGPLIMDGRPFDRRQAEREGLRQQDVTDLVSAGALRHPVRDRLLFQISEEAVEGHAVVAGGAARGWCCNWSGWNCNWLS